MPAEPLPDHPSPPFPAFDLPPWGTEGAPEVEPDAEGEAGGGGGPLLTTLTGPARRPGGRPLGVVTGAGSAKVDGDPVSAVERAAAAALERLAEAGRALGAGTVEGVVLTPVVRSKRATVLAAGTAMTGG
jgi:hypothetical protein